MLGEWQGIWPHLVYGSGFAGLAGLLCGAWLRLGAVNAALRRERRGREEMEAYLRLDTRVAPNGDVRALACRVCDIVAARSVFSRVAMLTRDAKGGWALAASVGMEVEITSAIERWARRMTEEEQGWNEGIPVGVCSRTITLSKKSGRVLMVPLGTSEDRIEGALVVCAESMMQVPRRLAEEAAVGLEALAVKLARAMEPVDPGARLSGTQEATRCFSPERIGREEGVSRVSGAVQTQSGAVQRSV